MALHVVVAGGMNGQLQRYPRKSLITLQEELRIRHVVTSWTGQTGGGGG